MDAVTLTKEEYDALVASRDTVTIPRAEYERLKQGDADEVKRLTAELDRFKTFLRQVQAEQIQAQRQYQQELAAAERRGWAHTNAGGI